MLTSIELSGFKSFADRTRMDFSEGISVLVGPNGSGKSNIVDAIKWVLGEQSVKKLRGSEMTDVIFNGSETRAPANVAEVTLSFDNRNRFFDLDAAEVHLTRRVYRSGESEYLVNRQASRLKDIRELLSGTGLGLQAYSIIEQGRVELLLQSTPVQRRGILEEAAGVARFNAKKMEVLRQLARVEQNLLRVSDIVNEIEGQLRNTKSQAGKAQLYRQYVARMQELRTESSLIEWREKKGASAGLETEIETLGARKTELEERVRSAEAALLERSRELDAADASIRGIEGNLAAVREKIAGTESNVDFQFSQIEQLEKEILENGRQLLSLNMRRGDTEEMMRKTDDEIFEAKTHLRQITALFESRQSALEELIGRCGEQRRRLSEIAETLRANGLEQTRLDGEREALSIRSETLDRTQKKRSGELESLREQMDELLRIDGELRGESGELSEKLDRVREQIAAKTGEKSAALDELAIQRNEWAEQKQRLSGTCERISLLEELLRRHEGLSPGVKEVLRESVNPSSPFRHVHGLVADLIRVNPEAAPLIELALGQKAQYLVVSPDPEFFRHIERNKGNFSGMVCFTWLDPKANVEVWKKKGIYEGRPGVLGRADRFVETDPKYGELIWRLLGRTWIVESYAVAKALYRESDGQTGFITLTGESLVSDGTLIVGPMRTSSGLITRRTELRTLAGTRAELDVAVSESTARITLLEKRNAEIEKSLTEAEEEFRECQNGLDRLRLQQMSNRKEDRRVRTQFDRLNAELTELAAERERLDAERKTLDERLAERIRANGETEAERDRTAKESEELQTLRAEESKKTTGLKIELAKSEERLDFLTARKNQFEENQTERRKLLADHNSRYAALLERRDAAEMAVLTAESNLAIFYSRKEEISGALLENRQTRGGLVAAKKKTEQELKKAQQELAKIRESIHAKELSVERLLQEQRTLAERMREDYGVDLAAELARRGAGDSSAETEETGAGSHEECLAEIESLKTKMNRLGSVNLEAIETLENLETRYTKLFNQYNDLLKAKKEILRIIERTKNDSQRLFEETFDAVKIYFCDIFQRLFGGGHADLVFDDPENRAESGIDLVVRPPGKDLKSVMLLSGGEKTLTCVAFLLAIFRYRANPVCILDEVDAALDEGNVGRFTAVIRESKTDTQFFIITHSKKTMTAAKTMYGVTMEDSGVSKLIGVQFDDVGEDGQILIKSGNAPPKADESAA